MGQSASGIVFYKGAYGGGDKKIKQMRLPFIEGDAPDHAQVWTLVQLMGPYTDAKYVAYENILKETRETDPSVGATVNLDVKARIAFKDSSDGKLYRIEIPAPKATIFEAQGEGDRVNQTDLAAIVGILSTAFERTFIPLWGKKIQRS